VRGLAGNLCLALGVGGGVNELTVLTFGMAEMHFQERRYREAVELLEGISAEFPRNADVRTLLARSYFHAAMLSKAEAEARALLELSPVDTYALLLLVRSLERLGRADEAACHRKMLAALTGDPGRLDRERW
jgi:hypothetical protein